jgi:hypothetical protein
MPLPLGTVGGAGSGAVVGGGAGAVVAGSVVAGAAVVDVDVDVDVDVVAVDVVAGESTRMAASVEIGDGRPDPIRMPTNKATTSAMARTGCTRRLGMRFCDESCEAERHPRRGVRRDSVPLPTPTTSAER